VADQARDEERDDERGEPDQRTSLVPTGGTPQRRQTRFPWSRKGGDGGVVEDGAEGAAHEATEAGLEPRDGGRQRVNGRIRAFLGVVADRIADLAPRIPVRDRETLQRQFPGLGPEEIADKLVAGAQRGSATVGAGVGAVAMLPVPPTMPAELAAEIVGVASVELKLIAELHEIYGRRPPGNTRQRAYAYVGAWASERGIDITSPGTLNAALGGKVKRELRQRLLKRTVRNLPNLAPFMVGAAVGAAMNHRDTKKLAEKIRADLRAPRDGWELPSPAVDGDKGLGGPGPALPPGR
jgi:hypothetical protein